MDVLIVSSDASSRSRLAAVLADQQELRFAGNLSPEEVLDHIGGLTLLRAVLWDLSPGEHIPSELRGVARAGIPLVCLVTFPEESRRARAAGASGVVLRSRDPEAMAAAIRAVAAGLVVLDPQVDPGGLPESSVQDALIEPLTPRETDVLALIAEGLTNKAIAVRLGIRESTVKDHVNALMDKLEAQSRTEAVILALRRGLLSV